MQIILFFTSGVSLKNWVDSGLIGRETRIYQELIKKGFKVCFLTYGDNNDRKWEKDLGRIYLLPIYERIPRFNFKFARILEAILIPFFFRKELRESFCFKTNQIWGGWVAVICKWIYQKPLIARCGYEYYSFCLKQRRNKLYCSLAYIGSWFTYKFSNFVNVATEADKNFVINKFNISENKIKVRPNWIDCNEFSPTFAKRNNCLLAVGRLNEQKNLALLFKSLEDTGHRLDLVGQGELYEVLVSEALELGLNVKFLGKIPNDKMPKLYRSCTIYIISSDYEGNPKSLLEAMASGCAVIGTEVSGIRELIKHDKTGLLVNADVKSLRDAINSLISNEKKRKYLADNAREYVRNYHSLEVILKKEISMFEEISKKTKN